MTLILSLVLTVANLNYLIRLYLFLSFSLVCFLLPPPLILQSSDKHSIVFSFSSHILYSRSSLSLQCCSPLLSFPHLNLVMVHLSFLFLFSLSLLLSLSLPQVTRQALHPYLLVCGVVP